MSITYFVKNKAWAKAEIKEKKNSLKQGARLLLN